MYVLIYRKYKCMYQYKFKGNINVCFNLQRAYFLNYFIDNVASVRLLSW